MVCRCAPELNEEKINKSFTISLLVILFFFSIWLNYHDCLFSTAYITRTKRNFFFFSSKNKYTHTSNVWNMNSIECAVFFCLHITKEYTKKRTLWPYGINCFVVFYFNDSDTAYCSTSIERNHIAFSKKIKWEKWARGAQISQIDV